MKKLTSIPKKIGFMIQHRQMGMMLGRLRYRIYSNAISFGLRRDLWTPHISPEPGIPVHIRPIENRDVHQLFDINAPNITSGEREERMARLLLLQSKLPTCYVAVTEDDTACFAGWLFRAADNEKIQQYFRNGFPRLKPDEALFEFAYTHEAFRGLHIMPYSMARIAEKAAEFGARWVIAFADHRNISTLRRCKLAGFDPFERRYEKCRFFSRTVAFEPMPEGIPLSVPEGIRE